MMVNEMDDSIAQKQHAQAQKRWTALSAAIDAAITDIERPEAASAPADSAVYARRVLACMLHNLREFTQRQIDYFGAPDRAVPEYFSSGFALSLTLRQASIDLSVITQAAAQRLTASEVVDRILMCADDIARWSLMPALKAGLIPRFSGEPQAGDARPAARVGQLVPFVYFQKSPVIRVMPYAPAAFVGVPYWVTLEPRDLMAIPHEMGHYVFWNGRLPDGGAYLYNAMFAAVREAHVPEWAAAWAEEVFADVYGARVAGPMIALDFQDMHLWMSDVALHKNEGEHPPAALRPAVYIETLAACGLGPWGTALRKRWNLALAARPNRNPSPSSEAENEAMAKNLSILVAIANQLLAQVPFDQDLTPEFPNGAPEIDSPETVTALEPLYNCWQRLVAAIQPDRAVIFDNKIDLCRLNWSPEFWKSWLDDLVQDDMRTDPRGVKEEEDAARAWFVALGAGGWTDGPAGGPRYP